MIDSGSRPPGTGGFVAELNAFYESCNRPPYRKLADISERLTALYGKRGLPVLSATAVFEVLAGRRKRAPSSAWVASFVLCCQRRAWETGVLASDPGISTLPGWQSRLRTAQSAPPADRSAQVRLTASQRASIENHGAHGRELLDRAAADDPDAAYRLAVLLGTDSGRGPGAVRLLAEAAAGGHAQAADLLGAGRGGIDHRTAARHAHRLGKSAAERAGGDRAALATALVYYKAAVQGGRLDAAFEITEILRYAGPDLAGP
ncbi:hypothetical protein E1293_40175 [Actinomadura darangshiensis]|uniref:Uncharacterized protein n=1 Tax=Actinomadura darangshiensis TaxID=705336 RepID=A0A4R5A254_9ACTN|nr:hypothetical protein [Actinomadura darangshiensis]TDD65515.1 hypothetical protein E1293_40175 [Actinomadura darangshiensis]